MSRRASLPPLSFVRLLALAAVMLRAGVPGAAASADEPDAGRASAAPANCLRIEAFVRRGSPQSDAAAKFLAGLADRRPGVTVEVRDVAADPAAEDRAKKLLAEHRVSRPGLPVIHACRQVVVGYRSDETTGRRVEALLTVDAYVRDGCPHCADGKRFLERMRKKYPGFAVRYHEITKEPGARDRLLELAKRYKVQVANVPAFHLCGTLVIGYDRDETTGRRLETLMRESCVPCPGGDEASPGGEARRGAPAVRSWISSAVGNALRGVPRVVRAGSTGAERHGGRSLQRWFRQTDPPPGILFAGLAARPARAGGPPDAGPLEELPLEEVPLEDLPADAADTGPVASPRPEEATQTVDLPLFGEVDVRRLGLPLFTLAVGLVDGFNPCAMWVLLFLLSILVNLKDRWKILAVAGTFVLISGLAYYAFMAAWLNVFLLVGFLRPAQIALGLLAVFVGAVHVKDFFALHKGISFSIPESAKPGIYARVRKIVTAENPTGAILGAAVLAVLVNVVELLCTAGLPALYTQVLALRELPAWQNYAYLALYNLAYMADDALMVGLVVVTLGRRKMQERHGRRLKLVSGLVVLGLGLVLLFKPEWLV